MRAPLHLNPLFKYMLWAEGLSTETMKKNNGAIRKYYVMTFILNHPGENFLHIPEKFWKPAKDRRRRSSQVPAGGKSGVSGDV